MRRPARRCLTRFIPCSSSRRGRPRPVSSKDSRGSRSRSSRCRSGSGRCRRRPPPRSRCSARSAARSPRSPPSRRLRTDRSHRCVIGGWLGVPIGALLLHSVDPQRFRLAIGALLTCYALFAIFVRDPGSRHGRRTVAGCGLRAVRRGARRLWRHVGLRAGDLGRSCAAGSGTSGARPCRPRTSPCTS